MTRRENGRPERRPLTAELLYDTQTQRLPRGLRTLLPSERRLLFAADAYEVMLEVARDVAAEWFCVTGQVLAAGAPIADALVSLDGSPAIRTDGNGSFRAVLAYPSRCQMQVQVDGWELALPPFTLLNTTPGRAVA